jgi:hypothetical protein
MKRTVSEDLDMILARDTAKTWQGGAILERRSTLVCHGSQVSCQYAVLCGRPLLEPQARWAVGNPERLEWACPETRSGPLLARRNNRRLPTRKEGYGVVLVHGRKQIRAALLRTARSDRALYLNQNLRGCTRDEDLGVLFSEVRTRKAIAMALQELWRDGNETILRTGCVLITAPLASESGASSSPVVFLHGGWRFSVF